MNKIETRIAKIEDLPQIVEIYNQAIVSKKSTGDIKTFNVEERLGWFKDHDPEKYPIIVAYNSDRIVGYIYLSPCRKGREALEKTVEVSYYIHSDYQRIGVGTTLLKTMLAQAKSANYKTIIAILFDVNEGSKKLLTKYNFQKWGVLPGVVNIDNKNYSHYYFGLKL